MVKRKYPQNGWSYVGMGEVDGRCAVCGKVLKFAHYIRHDAIGEIVVGGTCADKLTGTNTASLLEAVKRSTNGKVNRLENAEWHRNGNVSSADYNGCTIRIKKAHEHYSLQVEFLVDRHEDFMIATESVVLNSEYLYPTFSGAVRKAYNFINQGGIDLYKKRGQNTL